MNIKTLFETKKNEPSDINEHLPVLYRLAERVNTITECGTRHGDITTAFLAATENTNKKVVSYDLYKSPIIDFFTTQPNFTFHQSDTLSISIEQTDLLFIDTLHTYHQLYNELVKHNSNVSTYIVLHDTTSYGEIDEPLYDINSDVKMSHLSEKTEKTGLKNAISDFLKTEQGQNWFIGQTFENNNGLTILKRITKTLFEV